MALQGKTGPERPQPPSRSPSVWTCYLLTVERASLASRSMGFGCESREGTVEKPEGLCQKLEAEE